jgi:cell division protein YceG involved in septum cleavage
MEKLWTKYSYSIILIICSFITCLVVAICISHEDENQYMSVTVEKGDSIWQISEQFEGKYAMSNKEFIKWVEKQNSISANQLAVGEEITIPVRLEEENLRLASE